MEENRDGLSLRIWVDNFADLQLFVERCVSAGIVRCLSPERLSLCDSAATHVYWQDQAEWYPCCEYHSVPEEQWVGSTRFWPHLLDLPVIPDRAKTWLAGLSAEERSRIQLEEYVRSAACPGTGSDPL